MRQVAFTVYGSPVSQGSMMARVTGDGRPYLHHSRPDGLTEWRRAVRDAARAHANSWIRQSPVEVRLYFNAKPVPSSRSEREWCAVAPDIDKLTRAVLDALVQGKLLVDDAQVVRLIAEKHYGTKLGVHITVTDVSNV